MNVPSRSLVFSMLLAVGAVACGDSFTDVPPTSSDGGTGGTTADASTGGTGGSQASGGAAGSSGTGGQAGSTAGSAGSAGEAGAAGTAGAAGSTQDDGGTDDGAADDGAADDGAADDGAADDGEPDAAACAPATADCDHDPSNGCETPIDTTANCGACGNVCSPSVNALAVCENGTCGMLCAPLFGDCDGDKTTGCETSTTSVQNCGGCGNVCAAPLNASALCDLTSTCSYVCNASYLDCDHAAGCEVDKRTDVKNCGACGILCGSDHALPSCNNGTCTEACSGGWADCNAVSADGCEVYTDQDVKNCGACKHVCGTNHATAACNGGKCSLACANGWGDCNGTNDDGCEKDIATDAANCGACGNQCPSAPHAAPSCSNGQCGLKCDANWGNCDNDVTNGCEADLLNSVSDCGGCGYECSDPIPPHMSELCLAGSCAFPCMAQWGNCNGSFSDGCEVYLDSDPHNCGTCGNDCGTGTCSSGTCKP